jgi:ribosomal protein S12 methylthiotransferase RimO
MNKTVTLISLGCDKNRVDGERILYKFMEAGYSVSPDSKDADVIVVNTCSFIEPARKESIDAILEQIGYKKEGKKLIVTGCLAERNEAELKAAIPEIDEIVCLKDNENIVNIIDNPSLLPTPCKLPPAASGRIQTTPLHYAYLKIADGCDNYCSYCAIPFIRGGYKSEPFEKLVKEAAELAENGVKELIIIAQDVTRYGVDLYGKYRLAELLAELAALPFKKIRLMYAYPELVTAELIELIASNPKIAKYIDLPLQHIDDGILKRMNRRSDSAEIRSLLEKLRREIPDIAIRSSFIVGFPGETEEEFDRLKAFIAEGGVDYAGFFAYSREEGTAAFDFKPQISAKVKKERLKILSELEVSVIYEKHKKYLGKTLEVVYEGIDYKKGLFYGRNEYNAPDIDTKVYFSADFPLDIGEYYSVEITETAMDLKGKVKEEH